MSSDTPSPRITLQGITFNYWLRFQLIAIAIAVVSYWLSYSAGPADSADMHKNYVYEYPILWGVIYLFNALCFPFGYYVYQQVVPRIFDRYKSKVQLPPNIFKVAAVLMVLAFWSLYWFLALAGYISDKRAKKHQAESRFQQHHH
ncbi:hypothetical protein L9G15_05415 [Shewanella sp. A3A]|nr:hypothetical protein [Shewanella ferrihydritica]